MSEHKPSPDAGQPDYEARHVAGGMPADCCNYGVVSLSKGKEVCRVWDADDARLIAQLLNTRALRPAAVPGDMVEAAAKAHCDFFGGEGWWDTGLIADTKPKALDAMRAALTTMQPALQAAVWQPIETARKDRSVIWACLRNDLHIKRADLYRWSGIQVPLRHPGIASDGFDCGWNIAAPVGHGGFPDDWIAGWMPLAAQPENLTTLRSVEAPKP